MAHRSLRAWPETGVMLTVFGVAAFIVIEIAWGVAALLWSVSGYFHLNQAATWTMAALIVPPAAYAAWRSAVLAWYAETEAAAD